MTPPAPPFPPFPPFPPLPDAEDADDEAEEEALEVGSPPVDELTDVDACEQSHAPKLRPSAAHIWMPMPPEGQGQAICCPAAQAG